MGLHKYLMHDRLAIEIARRYCGELGEPCFVAIGEHAKFDIRSLSGKVKIEIKQESTPSRTGRVCIEYWNSSFSAPSGVLETEANIWLHLIPCDNGYEAIEYDIHRLRKLVIEEGERKTNGRNSLIVTIPVDVFRQHALRVFPFQSHFAVAEDTD